MKRFLLHLKLFLEIPHSECVAVGTYWVRRDDEWEIAKPIIHKVIDATKDGVKVAKSIATTYEGREILGPPNIIKTIDLILDYKCCGRDANQG